MANPHDHPTAPKDFQGLIDKEKERRARCMDDTQHGCSAHGTTGRLETLLAELPPL